MYRVFLADADAAMRDFYRGSLPQSPREFQIVGEAPDGETAMVMIRDLKTDLLIADLDLPFMDGVTLCRRVRQELPWVRVVLLGSDDDPVRRREVEALDGSEYLLRPVSAYELSDAVSRAAESIDRSARTLSEKIMEARRSVPQERRQWEQQLYQWILDGSTPCPEDGHFGRYCRLLTLNIAGIAEQRAWIAGGILRLLERDQKQSATLFAVELPQRAAIAVAGDDPVILEEVSYRIAETALCSIEHFTGERLNIAVSPCLDSAESLRQYCLRRVVQPSNPRRICGPGDVIRRCPGTRRRISALTERMLCADAEEMRALVNQLWRIGQNWSRIVAESAAALMCEAGEETHPLEPAEADGIRVQWPPQQGCDRQSVQLCRAVAMRESIAPELSRRPINRARCFLANSLHRPGIPLHAAAQEAGMTVSRFSVVFAQEMGMSFSEYLVHMRVNAAKSLLTATRMRPSSIVQRVGYSDERHFAAVFQRYVGMTMQEYRRRNAGR